MGKFQKKGENGVFSPPLWYPADTHLRLASASARRLALLQQVGLNPEVWPAHVDETCWPDEPPDHYVARMANTKAMAGVADHVDLVLGADTAVVLGDEIMGKPVDAQDAMAMLGRLSGKTHRVLTGVAVVGGLEMVCHSVVVASEVRVKSLTLPEIKAYIATGEPMDKAGAYAIQGMGAFMVADVRGSYSGVVGLPLFETLSLLERFGLTFFHAG